MKNTRLSVTRKKTQFKESNGYLGEMYLEDEKWSIVNNYGIFWKTGKTINDYLQSNTFQSEELEKYFKNIYENKT